MSKPNDESTGAGIMAGPMAGPMEDTDAASNPLLRTTIHVPFDRIRAEHIVPAIEHHLAQAKATLEVVKSLEGALTYDNTLGAMEQATEALDWAFGVAGHLESVATYPELREAWNAVQEPVSAFHAGVPMDPTLWKVVQRYSETEDARSLTGARARHLEKTLDYFRRHGAELDETGKAELADIEVELSKLTTRFAENVLDSTNEFQILVTEEKDLSGLPARVVEAARENAKQKGLDGFRFTLQAPSFIPLVTYLDDASIRERAWRAFSTRATEGNHDNRPLLKKILWLRRRKANLLGYSTFSDLVLEDRMAKTGRVATRFVDDLCEKTKDFFARENEELEEFRRRNLGGDDGPMHPWEVAYWAEKQRRALYDLDPEALRPYFSLEASLEGLFELAHRLFGVRVVTRPDMTVWDPSVRAYALLDQDDSFLGAFYVDVFPRENKRGGAWMDILNTGQLTPSGPTPHLGLFAANFNPPSAEGTSLLDHGELRTLFHEFGHLLHLLLSRVEVRKLAGANTAWDFVELPSQLLEEWTWEKDMLSLFARHYLTGEELPDELLHKLLRARCFRAGNAMMRQLGFASMDLALHIDLDPTSEEDPMELAREIFERHSPTALPAEHATIASFTHVFADPVGYASGYYSYKWAEVLAADAFSLFKERGVMDAATGRALRDKVLSRGDSVAPMELFVSLMGREPRSEALLEREGLWEPRDEARDR